MPSRIANSSRVSHCSASWSCGTAAKISLELAQHPRLVDRLDLRLVLGVDERADRRQRRRQRDLEAHVRRDHAVALELGEDRDTTRSPRRRSRGCRARCPRRARRRAAAAWAACGRCPSPGGPTSNCGSALNTGYCHRIQSDRGPGSPSGSRRRRSPSTLRGAAEDLLDAAQRHAADEMRAHRPCGASASAVGGSARLRCPPSRSSPARSSSLIASRSGPAATGPRRRRPARRRYGRPRGGHNAPEGGNHLLHGAVLRAIARAC